MADSDYLVEELIVALPHEPGGLKKLCKTLANAQVNIRGFGLEIPQDVGFMRLIVDKTVTAKRALAENNLKFSHNKLIAIGIPHEAGAFLKLAEIYDEIDENILYCYHLIDVLEDYAIVVFYSKNYNKVLEKMKEKNIKIFTKQQIQSDK